MAELSVEVDEIGKDQVTVGGIVHRAESLVEHGHVAGCLAHLGDAPVSKDVADLADGDHPVALRRQSVEQRRLRWRHGIVTPVVRALERGGGFPDERPGDHPADPQGIDQPAHGGAEFVEPLQPEMLLVRGNLKDGIDRGVADRLAGTDMLLAETLDDLGAWRVAVAEDTRHLAFADHRLGQFGRKGRYRVGEVTPVEAHRQRGDFPVARRRVLAAGNLLRGAVERGWQRSDAAVVEIEAGGRPGGGAETQPGHVGDGQRSAAQARAVGAPRGAGFGYMPERVGAAVAIAPRVGRAAYAEGVENEKESARHGIIVACR